MADVRALLSLEGTSGAKVREACRNGSLTTHTSGLAPGKAQANVVILPRESALDFLMFCTRNPKPCPLLEVLEAGEMEAKRTAPGSDIRSDLPRYRVWRDGEIAEEVTDISHLWEPAGGGGNSSSGGGSRRSDWVTFLLGCSFSFEEALLKGGVPVRHLQESKEEDAAIAAPSPRSSSAASSSPSTSLVANPRNVPMYRTNIACDSAGPFKGPLVVSMRPMLPEFVDLATRLTAEFPSVHGRPVHAGEASALGIADLAKPDYGDAVTLFEGEVPVFWACGVTPQAALLNAKLPIAITHAPGHMLVLDVSNASLAGTREIVLQATS